MEIAKCCNGPGCPSISPLQGELCPVSQVAFMMCDAWGPEYDVVIDIRPPLFRCMLCILCQLNSTMLLGLLSLYEILVDPTDLVSFYHLEDWCKSPGAFLPCLCRPNYSPLAASRCIFPPHVLLTAQLGANDYLYQAKFFWCGVRTLNKFHRVAKMIDAASTARPWYVLALVSHPRQRSTRRFIMLCTACSRDMSHQNEMPKIVLLFPLGQHTYAVFADVSGDMLLFARQHTFKGAGRGWSLCSISL